MKILPIKLGIYYAYVHNLNVPTYEARVNEGNFYICVNFGCNAEEMRNRNTIPISATYICALMGRKHPVPKLVI
jgi:hypothetical protein